MIPSNDVPRLLFWDGVFADVGCERSMPTRLTKPCNDRRAVSFLSVASVVSLESLEADGRGEITERSGFIGVAYTTCTIVVVILTYYYCIIMMMYGERGGREGGRRGRRGRIWRDGGSFP